MKKVSLQIVLFAIAMMIVGDSIYEYTTSVGMFALSEVFWYGGLVSLFASFR